jgi:transposase-like protein
MKHNPQGITTAMQLYFGGESLRNTADSVRLIGMDVNNQTVYSWIKKYITLMARYLEQIKPNVSNAWRAPTNYMSR